MMWYYKEGELEVGPVSKSQLQRLIKAGRIGLRTAVRRADLNRWQPLADWVKGQHPQGAPVPPPDKPDRVAAPASAPPPPPTDDASARTASRAPQSRSKTIPFKFNGNGAQYFKIWIVNVLLSALTLGIYSAWAKVRRKQYFYGNTAINGASFQYLADPIKILKGRLIIYIFWPMLMLPTLGCIAPYLYYRQKEFMVDHSAYGTTRFGFKATAGDYYKMALRVLIPFVICMLLAAGIGSIHHSGQVMIPVVMVVFYLYALAYFAVKSSNLLFNSASLAAHGFKADMTIKDFVIIVVTNTLATMVTLGFFHPFAKVRAYRYKLSRLALVASGDLDQFVADEQKQIGALGDEVADFMDFDLGL